MAHLSVDEARAICGGLSRPSKMPGPAYSLPAKECHVGGILVGVKDSVCHNCYARKGRYPLDNVQRVLYKRLASLKHQRWAEAVSTLILASATTHFRWHDSGDLQGHWHLDRIFEVCARTPRVKHWLPTKEYEIIGAISLSDVPPNLVIRVSSPLINGDPVRWWRHTSTVVSDGSHTCVAPLQDNQCGLCRKCWQRSVRNLSYKNK